MNGKQALKGLMIIITLICIILPAKANEGIASEICPRPTKAVINNDTYLPLQTVTIICKDMKAVGWAEKHLREWYSKKCSC